jgi:hypothetical protein
LGQGEYIWGKVRAFGRGGTWGEDIGRLSKAKQSKGKEVFAVKNLINSLLCVIMRLFLDEKHTRKR